MSAFEIAVLGGDGIGPEVTAEGARALMAVGQRFGHTFTLHEALVGQAAIDREGVAISEETMALCQRSDAILFGAVGGTGVGDPNSKTEPMHALFRLRRDLELFANVRPVRPIPALLGASTLKRTTLRGVDMLVVRELTGGIYYGKPSAIHESASGASAVDTMVYTEAEIARIARYAFELARDRRKHVTSVDKANVLSCSRLWRRVVDEVHTEYPDVTLRHMLVDACSMALIRNPREFDVVVTENLFGDILTDEASMLTGSLGMAPSASLGAQTHRAWAVWPLRADSRFRARHCGPGQGESARLDPDGGAAVALLAGPQARSRSGRTRRAPGRRGGLSYRRHRHARRDGHLDPRDGRRGRQRIARCVRRGGGEHGGAYAHFATRNLRGLQAGAGCHHPAAALERLAGLRDAHSRRAVTGRA